MALTFADLRARACEHAVLGKVSGKSDGPVGACAKLPPGKKANHIPLDAPLDLVRVSLGRPNGCCTRFRDSAMCFWSPERSTSGRLA